MPKDNEEAKIDVKPKSKGRGRPKKVDEEEKKSPVKDGKVKKGGKDSKKEEGKAKRSGDESSPDKKKKKKDPAKPKKALSGYFFFGNSIRARLVKENQTAKVTDIAKLISAEWAKISDKGKEKYTKMNADDKIRYEKQLKEYEDKGYFKRDDGTRSNVPSKADVAKAEEKSKKREEEKAAKDDDYQPEDKAKPSKGKKGRPSKAKSPAKDSPKKGGKGTKGKKGDAPAVNDDSD
jgi:hypothetical protein